MFKTRLLLAVGLSFVFSVSCVAQCIDHATLSDSDRRGFLAAAYGKDTQVAVEFLAAQRCDPKMLAALGRLGAKVKYSDAKVGYALVTLPKDKILDALDITGIAYAMVSRIYKDENLIPTVDREAAPIPPIEIPFPRVATTLPANGPYFAAGEAGLTDLWKQHPNADGRGVRVAVVDEGIDLLHPALEKALDARGELVPKVADIATVTGPDENANWVEFSDPIEVTSGTFAAADRTWTAPSNGSYRFGIYERTLILGPERNSHTKKLALGVGVLWNEQQGRVWVDTLGDGDFSKETPLKDYSVSQDIAFFGIKSSGGDNRISFGVKIDRERLAVYVAVANGGHGTFVAGPLAANRLTGGLFDGAAPNAQLVDEVFGVTNVLSVLRALARPDVDVVNRSGGLARYLDGDREGFARHVVERAMAVYDKPIVSFSAGKNLLQINDYVSGEMLRRNRQIGPPYVDAMNSFVWFEPEGVVNTVLGPSGSLVTMSRYVPLELQWDDGRRYTYDDKNLDPPAPAGYGIGSNNSPTIPIISGVLADLISQARQSHVRYSAPRLYQALTTSSRLVPGFPLSEQGYGEVNAASAWDRLAKMAVADDPSNPELTSFKVERTEGGVRKEVNGFLAKTSKAGEPIDGELWITRQGGYAGGRAYRLSLRANEGAFTLVDTKATFVQGKTARVRFRAISKPKWNLAFLQLIDEKTGAVMEEVPLSIQAPDVPEIVGPGVERYQATTPPRHEEYGYVQLNQEVQAARFAMQIPFDGGEGISGRHLPPRLTNAHDDATGPAGEPVDAAHHVGPIETLETLFPNEKPGIQNFYWENRGSHAEYETQYDEPPAATVPIAGSVTVTKYAVAIARAKDGLTLTNKLADIEGKLEIYDAKLASSEVSGEGAHASVDVQRAIPAHLNQWRIAVSSSSVPPDSADAFLLNCTDAKDGCFVAAQQVLGKSGATIVIDNPKEGNWRIVVRTRDRIDKAVKYDVREASLVPSATPIESSDEKHASGSTWSVALPAQQSDAQYVDFHLAGAPQEGVRQDDGAKDGVRIALTALEPNAP